MKLVHINSEECGVGVRPARRDVHHDAEVLARAEPDRRQRRQQIAGLERVQLAAASGRGLLHQVGDRGRRRRRSDRLQSGDVGAVFDPLQPERRHRPVAQDLVDRARS